MFKTLAFCQKMGFFAPFWAFRGPLALHLRLLAIVIIPNLAGMFNNNITILLKNCQIPVKARIMPEFLILTGIVVLGVEK